MKLLRRIALLALIFCSSACFTRLEASSDSGWLFYKGSSDRSGVTDQTVNLPLKIVWQYSPEGKTNGFVDWGAVAINGKVFTPDGLNHVLALDAKTGKVLWKKEVISNVFSVSLAEDGKILYVTTAITTKPTPTLFALDPETGNNLWDNMINNQPAVGGMEGAPAIKDGRIYAGYLQYEGYGGVVAYDAKTGQLLWHWKNQRYSPYSSLTFGQNLIYVGFENKTVYCLDAADGHVVWSHGDLMDLPFAASVVSDGKVYLGTGHTVYAFDAETGNVVWQKALEEEIGHSSLALYDKILYGGSRESKVFALKASNGDLVWSQDLKMGPIESSPIVDSKKKVIYLATQDNHLLVLSLKGGKVQSQVHLSDDPRGVWKCSPALYGGRLYIGSLDQRFYALE